MVLAVEAGEKTQTRRLAGARRPWRPGRVLWVREPWALAPGVAGWRSAAPGDVLRLAHGPAPAGSRRVSQRFMPRAFARLHVRVIDAEAVRLHDLPAADAEAEGVGHWLRGLAAAEAGAVLREAASIAAGLGWGAPPGDLRGVLGVLWRRLHSAESWRANPEVVRVRFERVDPAAGGAP